MKRMPEPIINFPYMEWHKGLTEAEHIRQCKIDAWADWANDCARDLAMIEELENPSD
jgi:hypothetical protein